MIKEREKVRRWIGKRDLQRPIIEDAKTDLVKVVDLSFIKCLRVGDRIKHVSNWRSERWRENAAIRIDEVLRNDRLAIGPLCVMPQVKHVNLFVRQNIPALRYTGAWMQIVRVLGNETFQQRGNDVERTNAVHDLWIEILHFLTVSFVQDLQPVAFFDVGLRAMAGAATKEKKT